MPYPRKWKDNAEKMRAYRARKKLQAGIAPPPARNRTKQSSGSAGTPATTKTGVHILPGALPTTTLDTRTWPWDKWALHFRGKKLLPHQVENLCEFDSRPTIDLDPRQHGKSSYVVETYIERKLCETVYDVVDRPLIYISSSDDNIKAMTNTVRDALYYDTRITDFYGDLIDYSRTGGRQSKSAQTQYEINLVTRKDAYIRSFRALTVDSRVRGGNAWGAVLDDCIDVREELDPEKATIKFLEWLKRKIIPLTKGNLLIIGTRYDTDDLYMRLQRLKIFKLIQRQAILSAIPGYVIPDFEPFRPSDIQVLDECHLLAPELWETVPDDPFKCGTPAQNIIYKLHIMGLPAFMTEFQNDPQPRNPVFKWQWFQRHDLLPDTPFQMQFACFVDTATGESHAADYNAFVLLARYKSKYYLEDMMHGRWSPLVRVQKLEQFVEENAKRLTIDRTAIRLCMEVVRSSGSDFYQLVRDRSWLAPLKINPKDRGKKEERIMNNLAAEAEAERISIASYCRDVRQFKQEVDSFPLGRHEHLMDAADQALHYLKLREEKYIPLGGKTSSRFTAR